MLLTKADIKSDAEDLQIACSNFKDALGVFGCHSVYIFGIGINSIKKLSLVEHYSGSMASMEGPAPIARQSRRF